MGTVRAWWRKLTGHQLETPQPAATPRAKPKAPAAAGLELADDQVEKRPSRVGAAGFDPYSSDAGFSKPHSWERVDHD